MKTQIKYSFLLPLLLLFSCTDLTETVYDQIGTTNFIQSRSDILALAIRPYDHAFWSIRRLPEIQENSADQWVTYTRNGTLWYDGGKYVRSHQHTWTWDDDYINQNWEACWAGIDQINNVLDILGDINPSDYDMDADEFNNLLLGDRTLRVWFYIRLLDMYRNIPLYKSIKNTSLNTETQVSPQQTFDFLESELLDLVKKLPQKESLGGNGTKQEQWNQAGAASLLVRLYLNSEKWTGTARYDKCEEYAQKIINGEYGPYQLDDVWDKPFKWNNITSDELIYAFESNRNHTYNHYSSDMYWWALPCGKVSTCYFDFTKEGNPNFRYALSPGLDVDGKEYDYQLGKPVRKFLKYPSDYRLKMYKNLGNGEREGMFLYGYIPNTKEGGYIKQTNGTDDLYIRDQAGFFFNAAPGATIDDKVSSVEHADDNSGWRMVKY
ncbi:MAG: RagB/SusD family nutrient uptake outer membrane protein, partial [Bacteroidota bacterium]|nr:RagB/SusD family nutrient uptake outer membrane protein [Bacteroidota bacterium]